jgi:hypothetical protein
MFEKNGVKSENKLIPNKISIPGEINNENRITEGNQG